MERRTFLAVVSGGLLAAPLAANLQQTPKVHRVGVRVVSGSFSSQTSRPGNADCRRRCCAVGRSPRLGGYVTGTEATRGVTAAGGR